MCSLLSFISVLTTDLHSDSCGSPRATVAQCSIPPNGTDNRRKSMAKGQVRGNKEAKKPKADGPKGHVSAYKQSLVKSGQALVLPKKKT